MLNQYFAIITKKNTGLYNCKTPASLRMNKPVRLTDKLLENGFAIYISHACGRRVRLTGNFTSVDNLLIIASNIFNNMFLYIVEVS